MQLTDEEIEGIINTIANDLRIGGTVHVYITGSPGDWYYSVNQMEFSREQTRAVLERCVEVLKEQE